MHSKFANIIFTVMEQGALLHLAYKLVSQKLQNPAHVVVGDPFFIVKLKFKQSLTIFLKN
jgi:hypothetical protein